jgi:uncharacterized membrane protein (DUF2068 family)
LRLNARRKLRIVAVVETIKGTLVLMLASGLLSMSTGRVQQGAQAVIDHLGWLPDIGLPQLIDQLADGFESHRLAFAALVAAYVLIRYVEAFGLWRQREWARWLGLIGVSIYIPFELHSLFQHPGWGSGSLLAFNLLVLWLLWPSKSYSPPAPAKPGKQS